MRWAEIGLGPPPFLFPVCLWVTLIPPTCPSTANGHVVHPYPISAHLILYAHLRHRSTFQRHHQTSGTSLPNVLVRCVCGFSPSVIACTSGIGFPPERCLVLVALVLPTSIFFSSGVARLGCRRSSRETGTATHRLSIENQLRTPGLGEPSRG